MMVVPPQPPPLQPPPLPKEFQPNDYLVVSIVVAIVCGLFNETSLVFSVPALVFSVMVSSLTSIAVLTLHIQGNLLGN